MKGSFTIMKPVKQRSKSAFSNNMFQDPERIEGQGVAARENIEQYDFVGPAEFRKKLITKYGQPMKMDAKEPTQIENLNQLNQTTTSKNPMNTTINRNTILSSLHKEQVNELTKQTKNLTRFKEYQDIWQKNKHSIQSEINKKNPLLMDSNIKSLYVHPNEDKLDIINHYIVHYWQMSLRNHNPILEKHIKGHRFEQVQKEKLLQLRDGVRKIQASIPALPIEKLQGFRHREISLNGRNKIKKELDGQSEQTMTRYSLPNTTRITQEQVFKIDYEGGKRWMGAENL